MARRIPDDRFDQLVDAATEVFIQRGYRLTQMADVAEAVTAIHRDYIRAGARVLTACTFRTHRRSLAAAAWGERAA